MADNPVGRIAGSIDGAVLPEGIRFEATTLTLPDTITFDEWATVGSFLRYAESAVRWWLGDWLAYGEHRWGEKYAQALDMTDYEYGTLANTKYVAEHVAPERRREKLSFSHHQTVAHLDPEEQDKMLDEAEKNGHTVRKLRHEIDEKAGRRFEDCPCCGARAEVITERGDGTKVYRAIT